VKTYVVSHLVHFIKGFIFHYFFTEPSNELRHQLVGKVNLFAMTRMFHFNDVKGEEQRPADVQQSLPSPHAFPTNGGDEKPIVMGPLKWDPVYSYKKKMSLAETRDLKIPKESPVRKNNLQVILK
jgi:hypothetical protein